MSYSPETWRREAQKSQLNADARRARQYARRANQMRPRTPAELLAIIVFVLTVFIAAGVIAAAFSLPWAPL